MHCILGLHFWKAPRLTCLTQEEEESLLCLYLSCLRTMFHFCITTGGPRWAGTPSPPAPAASHPPHFLLHCHSPLIWRVPFLFCPFWQWRRGRRGRKERKILCPVSVCPSHCLLSISVKSACMLGETDMSLAHAHAPCINIWGTSPPSVSSFSN